jgi:hypothetical protein
MENDFEGKQKDSIHDRSLQIILYFLAAAAFGGAILRMMAPGKDLLEKLDSTTLMYLGVAGALLLLRQVKSLAFGDFKVELERIEKVAKEAIAVAKIADDAATYNVTLRAGTLERETESGPATNAPIESSDQTSTPSLKSIVQTIQPGSYHDDPWKEVFGEKSETNHRRLKASVTPVANDSDWFKIYLVVESTSPKHDPLRGNVMFFLHNSFRNDKPIVPVGSDGKAGLNLKAWGAFTVGALADDGNTKLELDLAEMESAPKRFRER